MDLLEYGGEGGGSGSWEVLSSPRPVSKLG